MDGDGAKDMKYSVIKQIFQTMVYGEEEEDVSEAIEWLKSKSNIIFAYLGKPIELATGEMFELKKSFNEDILCQIYVPEAVTVENILKKFGELKNKWIDVDTIKRAELMFKLGSQIHKNQNIFAQLETVARGILSKDTKERLTLLTDYLQFYSSFCTKYNSGNSWKPEGLSVGIISDKNCISTLASILGPSLACGYNVVLQTGPQLSLSAAFLIDLAVQVGIPEGTIRLIPGNVDPTIFFTAKEVSIISIFDDIHHDKYLIGNHFCKKFLHFYSSGIPMLVFDNCDLDSACQSVVDAAWGYKGILPWSVRNILIQESVFECFVQKLKQKVNKILISSSNKKNSDISYPDNEVLQRMVKLTEKAKNEGVEVYQPQSNYSYPTLLIGGNVYNNNVIKADAVDVPVVTLTAFRTINEAVALANNTRQGFAASVWTESTSLAHEVVRKLKVGNVWINCHGLFAADISNSPHKTSGNAHFGGKNGLYEHIHFKNLKQEAFAQTPNGEVMEKAITEAKKAQESWNKLTKLERVKHLQVIAQNIMSNKSAWNLSKTWLDEWITSIYDSVTVNNEPENGFITYKKFNVLSFREPCGVIAMETLKDVTTHNKKLLITALIEGNSVIILNDSNDANVLYSSMGSLLPKGVLITLPSSLNIVKVAALHKELNVYFGEKNNNIFWSMPLKSSCKFKTASLDNWEDVYSKVTTTKNAWFNVGQSFN